jgi:VWFA-related protein
MSNLVPVPTLVRDNNGDAIYGLKIQDFVIEDDGIEQSIHLDETPEAQPISLVIAVQCGRRARREFGRTAKLSTMLDPVLSGKNNEAALLLFDSGVNLVQDFTTQTDTIEEHLKKLQPGDDGAAIIDAVSYAAKLLGQRQEGHQRVLLLISETRDHGSHLAKIDDVVRLVGTTNTQVFTLPFSPYISQQLDTARGRNSDEWKPTIDIIEKLAAAHQAMRKNIPQALASMTGGEYDLFKSRKGFESDLIDFSNHLESRYLLSFQPNDPRPGLHSIRVRLKHPTGQETLLFRRTYWVGNQSE